MAQFVPINRADHAKKLWRRPANYAFAAAEALLSIVGPEIAKVALAMPIAFIEQSGALMPVAVTSLEPGRNLFVGPKGQWFGRYVPMGLRSYPFRLAHGKDKDDILLCVDEDSVVTAPEVSAESFFDAEGKLTATVKDAMALLSEVERSRKATEVAMKALKEAGVICHWDVKVKTEEGERPVQGLHRVDEAALNGLDDAAFVALRKVSALTIAYAQLFSTDQMFMLPKLAQAQLPPAPPRSVQTPLERLLAERPDGLIQFS
jgi:hypothetical protein